MRSKRFGLRVLFGLLIAGLALSACAAPPAAPVVEQPVVQATTAPPAQPAYPAPAQVAAPAEGSAPAAYPAPAETTAAEQTQARPTPRPGLEASDPATVSLASGKVQLVEFFAFW
jgi:hypothetical protein